jgi:hypothetical protein
LSAAAAIPVKTLHFCLAAVDELDIDLHGLDQAELRQPAGERVSLLRPRNQRRQHRGDALQEFCRLAVIQEQTLTFLRLNDLAQIERHVQSRHFSSSIIRAAGDQRERLSLDLQRHVGGIPSAIDEEQVLLRLETQQRGKFESTRFRVFGEEDRIMRQESRKFSRDHAHRVDFCVLSSRPRGGDANIPVNLLIKNYSVCHSRLQPFRRL